MNSTFSNYVLTKPENIIFTNNCYIAFYDEQAVSKGHTLIIPKRNIKSIFSLNNLEQELLTKTIKRAKNIIQKRFSPDGYNLVVNEGESAGKVVNHLVVHLIPRYKGDVHNPVGSGARVTLGKFSEPARPLSQKLALNNYLHKDTLKTAGYFQGNPNKKFYLGLKCLIQNEEGKFLVLFRERSNFIGTIDIPGGRCEDRDKEEFSALQREVYEEIHAYIDNISFFDNFIFWDVNFSDGETNHTGLIINIYLARLDSRTKLKLLKKEKFIRYDWISKEELADRLTQYPLRIRDRIRQMSL